MRTQKHPDAHDGEMAAISRTRVDPRIVAAILKRYEARAQKTEPGESLNYVENW